MTGLTRRSLAKLLGLAALPIAPSRAAAAVLDLKTPEQELAAFLKVFLSLAKTRVWYWYTGVIDAAVPGGPVVPMFGVDTLIRRDVTPLGNSRFMIDMFEGTYFHAIDDSRPLDVWRNPLNDREVRPFHYREGPYYLGYDPRGPFDPKTSAPFPGSPPFKPQLRRAGDQVWFSRDYYIDVPHPLTVAEWPLESSGPRQTTGSFATHWAQASEVADPRILTAKSAFHYEAFMGWLPWLLMGQAPGQMVWRAAGTKLGSIADLPPAARAGFLATHPRLFDERPWNDFADLLSDYRKLRKPVLR